MTIEDVRTHLLHYLYRRNKTVTRGDLIGKTLGAPGSYDEIMSTFLEHGYVIVEDNNISLSEKGRSKMAADEKAEKERMERLIFEEEYDLALLEFLYFREGLVSLEDVPPLLKNAAHGSGYNDGPIHEVLFQLEKKGQVAHPYASWYKITDDGISYYKYQIAKFNRLHGIAEEQRPQHPAVHNSPINAATIQHLTVNHISGGDNRGNTFGSVTNETSEVDQELARQTLADIPKMKFFRRWGFWIGVIAATATIVTLVLAL